MGMFDNVRIHKDFFDHSPYSLSLKEKFGESIDKFGYICFQTKSSECLLDTYLVDGSGETTKEEMWDDEEDSNKKDPEDIDLTAVWTIYPERSVIDDYFAVFIKGKLVLLHMIDTVKPVPEPQILHNTRCANRQCSEKDCVVLFFGECFCGICGTEHILDTVGHTINAALLIDHIKSLTVIKI